jgi:3-oxoacyl-[acyl-carrier-protein] synthase III
MSPAYVLLSPGLDFKPNDQLSVFFSPVTARYVIVMDDHLAAQGAFGVDTGKHVKSEFGAYLSFNWVAQIAKNIVYKTRCDLFSDYKHNPQNIDVFWTNTLNLQVNKYISANISMDMIYDDDVKVFKNTKTGVMGPRLQIKEVIGVGFTAKF